MLIFNVIVTCHSKDIHHSRICVKINHWLPLGQFVHLQVTIHISIIVGKERNVILIQCKGHVVSTKFLLFTRSLRSQFKIDSMEPRCLIIIDINVEKVCVPGW